VPGLRGRPRRGRCGRRLPDAAVCAAPRRSPPPPTTRGESHVAAATSRRHPVPCRRIDQLGVAVHERGDSRPGPPAPKTYSPPRVRSRRRTGSTSRGVRPEQRLPFSTSTLWLWRTLRANQWSRVSSGGITIVRMVFGLGLIELRRRKRSVAGREVAPPARARISSGASTPCLSLATRFSLGRL